MLPIINTVTHSHYKLNYKDYPIKYGFGNSPFGKCLVGLTGDDICFLSFQEDDSISNLKKVWPLSEYKEDSDSVPGIIKSIFSPKPKINLLLKGTDLQIKVWLRLLATKKGQILTYESLAKDVGQPSAVRAVANAIGENNIAYLVPCHRIIRKSGHMGGYRWGTGIKKKILESEKSGRK